MPFRTLEKKHITAVMNMDTDPRTEIQKELSGGEKLLWTGTPKTGIRFRVTDIFLIPFSLLWCGFAVFWESTVIMTGAPLFFKLWGVPFIAVGIYFVIGRFIVEAWQRSRTAYGLTSERVIIITGSFTRKVNSVFIENLGELSFAEKPDGSGTISFGSHQPLSSLFSKTSWPGLPGHASQSFEMIPDAKRVYEMIRKTRKLRS